MAYYIGLDVGGTKCAACLGDLTKGVKVVDKIKFDTAPLGPYEVLEKYSCFIQKKLDEGFAIKGIGISCGGPLDSKKGVVMAPPSLPTWDGIPVVGYFTEKFGIPTYLQNDANAGAVAEWKFGAGRSSDNVVFITCGTGFGAGIIAGGHLITGINDNAGEVGHVRLAPNGPEGYHKFGSAEGFCSGGGIGRLATLMLEQEEKKGHTPAFLKEIGGKENVSAKTVAECAKKGDEFCLKVYKKSGKMLGQILSIIMDIINPEIICIGGVFMRSGELLLPEAMKVIKKEALPFTASACKIVPAELGESIGDYAALAIAKGDF